MKIAIITLCSVLLLGISFGATYVSYSNQEVRLRNQASAVQETNEVEFDKTWKVISQQAQVTGQYKDDFKDVYTSIMDERYDGDRAGALMSWVQEHNPNLDSSIYKTLMTTIEAQRESFNRRQFTLRDIKREHDNILDTFPGSLFLASREHIDVQLVSSTKAREAFETGLEDDVDLFGGGDKKAEAGG